MKIIAIVIAIVIVIVIAIVIAIVIVMAKVTVFAIGAGPARLTQDLGKETISTKIRANFNKLASCVGMWGAASYQSRDEIGGTFPRGGRLEEGTFLFW